MPMRALKTDDELAMVPLNEPVLVELPSAMAAFEEPNGEPDKNVGKTNQDDSDDAAKRLQSDLETLKAQNESNRLRAERAEADRLEAVRVAAERDEENKRLRERSVADEDALISNSLRGAQAERDAAKSDYKRAAENGDFDGMADAQSKLSRAEAKILHYESGAAELAERKETLKNTPEPKREPARADFAASVHANQQLLQSEKDWMIKNAEAFKDPEFNKKIEFAYQGAVAKGGLVRGSPEYFDYMERATGLKKGTETPSKDDDDDNERDLAVSAPPSRSERDSNGRPTGGKVMLTPEERDLARSMGVTDIEYARQKVAFDAARRADPAKYGDR